MTVKFKKFIPATKKERDDFLNMIDPPIDKQGRVRQNNLIDSFEGLYLRERTFKKALVQLGDKEISRLMGNKDFIACTTYMALRVFNKNKYRLIPYGFELEDIKSICKIFAISFHICKLDVKTDKDRYYLMMRYIGQRFHGFISNWSARKFGPIEISNSAHSTLQVNDSDEDKASFLKYFDFSEKSTDMENNLSDSLFLVTEHLDKINGIIDQKERRLLRKQKADLIKKKNDLKEELLSCRKDRRPASKTSKLTLKKMKKELNDNWEKYSDKIAHFATTIYTTDEIRKKARVYCRKYNIDFTSWAKGKVLEGTIKESDLNLR